MRAFYFPKVESSNVIFWSTSRDCDYRRQGGLLPFFGQNGVTMLKFVSLTQLVDAGIMPWAEGNFAKVRNCRGQEAGKRFGVDMQYWITMMGN